MVATFEELQAQVYELYSDKDYEHALELLNQHAHHFPLQAHPITLWKMCLAVRTEQESLAVWMLEEALAAGQWYAEGTLRSDPDLSLLAGNGEWERLLGICRERQDEAERSSMPVLLTAEPDGPPPPWPVLLAMHGSAWTGSGFIPHWRGARDAGWLVATPQSSQASGPDRYGWLDGDRTLHEIRGHLDSLRANPRADLSVMVAGGVSAGVPRMLRLVADAEVAVRGVIAVAPALPEDFDELAAGVAKSGAKIFLVGGRRDLFRSERLVGFAAALKAAGAHSDLRMYDDLGHAFPHDFDTVLRGALAWFTNPGA